MNPRPPGKGNITIDDVILEAGDKMSRALQAAKDELITIHTGRANPLMPGKIVMDCYGAPIPLQQLASLTISEARIVLISLSDRSAVEDIVTVIHESDLGVNPTGGGIVIRVAPPALTEERCKNYVKPARSRAGDFRVQVRGIHGRARGELEAVKKDGKADEDDIKRAEHELGGLAKRFVEQINAAPGTKKTGLLRV